MLNFGNKEFRNLQEQVLKNAQDIETLKGRENLQVVIVNELPEVGNPNYIYLVAKEDGESPDVYDEYIWLEDEERYEKIGGVTIDLTNYVTLDTEQTITGKKSFGSNVFPSTDNNFNLGSSALTWKDIYIKGKLDFNGVWSLYYTSALYFNRQGSGKVALLASEIQFTSYNLRLSGTTKITDNYNEIYFDSSHQINLGVTAGYPIVMWGSQIPRNSSSYDLGNSTKYWQNLYLTGNISDGVNTVSVTNIASKVTSTFISGTFDSNGESTIDTEQAGTPEGLFIFTYGNCQCFLRLAATMVNSADVTPIRISCPMIYNGATSLGWLNITKAGAILVLTITDGTNHVDSGYAWTLTKTNLL